MPRLLALLACLGACLALAVPSAQASRGMGLNFDGSGALLDPAQRDGALNRLDSLGVHSLRVLLYWNWVAPNVTDRRRPSFDATDPNAYNWGQYDALMGAAAARHWTVLMDVSGPGPNWASRGGDGVTYPSAAEFQKFMMAVGRHYGTQVSTWSIWNEPNMPQFLSPQFDSHHRAVAPGLYRDLFLAGRNGLRASGNGRDKVLMGETAPYGSSHGVAPLAFLRGALCLDGRYRKARGCGNLPADGYAHHAYASKAGPGVRPPGADDVSVGVLDRLSTALDRAARAGAVRKHLPIHLTEFGVQSYPDKTLGVPPDVQAEFLSLSERIAYVNARVASFSQYLLYDDPPIQRKGSNRYEGFQSGLIYSNGRPKPSYDGFRLALAGLQNQRGRGVSLYGHVRPAGGTTATVLYADGRGRFKKLKDVPTNGDGVFFLQTGYRKGRRYQLQWKGFDGATTYLGAVIHPYTAAGKRL